MCMLYAVVASNTRIEIRLLQQMKTLIDCAAPSNYLFR